MDEKVCLAAHNALVNRTCTWPECVEDLALSDCPLIATAAPGSAVHVNWQAAGSVSTEELSSEANQPSSACARRGAVGASYLSDNMHTERIGCIDPTDASSKSQRMLEAMRDALGKENAFVASGCAMQRDDFQRSRSVRVDPFAHSGPPGRHPDRLPGPPMCSGHVTSYLCPVGL